ncbi:HTH-type transcriptional regulator/antitoxin HipB [Nocardioides cavernae]|uniref:HTH-type transcriptional regulator/antitoxin HipB n=1 Tax=Nocardioides cavernae TaxID=1921566 RepID=A0A7Y9H605_9ACTN|nr:helix-turn-helix domain-containing protein [Nocardioides cavernae]NYE37929.1 HTH-type transcriptional regulator/antitoxin HipB [Nocardioides cavernae]
MEDTTARTRSGDGPTTVRLTTVRERHYPSREEYERLTDDEREWWSLGPFAGEVPGLVRRIRRILDVSQRGLAALLEVSQSVVARWETGRTSPRADVLQRMLRLARVRTSFHDEESGEVVEPMRDDGARDRACRRFPAHCDLRLRGWWLPRQMRTWTSAHALFVERESRRTGRVAIGYRASPSYKHLERTLRGTPVDHAARHQLVAEMEHRDECHAEWKRQVRLRAAGGS